MDRDLLMLLYGALIGVGSSIITTLFQTWLERREYKRRRVEDREEKKNQIYIPTSEEVRDIIRGKTNTISKLVDEAMGQSGANRIISLFFVIVSIIIFSPIFAVVILIGLSILVILSMTSTFYFCISALVTFILVSVSVQLRIRKP